VYESPEGEDSSQSIFLNPPPYQPPQKGQLRNRVVFGLLIGLTALGVVLAGGWVFTVIVAAIIWVATGEYFDLVQSKGITQGMPPPPPVATKVCSAICSAMPLMTLYFGGRVGVAVTTASFLLATVLLLQQGPRFSQLSSAIFGLFYCGYLPCFWIKLRCGLAVPAINTSKLVFVQLLCAGPMIEHISPSVLLHSWRTSIGQMNALW
jgi:phosphatidate cytidylyltransferase